ncbi:Apolipoprotein L3 [Labeo rohita]|uniref:Apolipoprotein L3 n=1 Tax=Labeo rohita TaxID=84645 RepID=A0ABQ8L304_LABRO|nr:Apolipoprotein L3 [Labeo rohita]
MSLLSSSTADSSSSDVISLQEEFIALYERDYHELQECIQTLSHLIDTFEKDFRRCTEAVRAGEIMGIAGGVIGIAGLALGPLAAVAGAAVALGGGVDEIREVAAHMSKTVRLTATFTEDNKILNDMDKLAGNWQTSETLQRKDKKDKPKNKTPVLKNQPVSVLS